MTSSSRYTGASMDTGPLGVATYTVTDADGVKRKCGRAEYLEAVRSLEPVPKCSECGGDFVGGTIVWSFGGGKCGPCAWGPKR